MTPDPTTQDVDLDEIRQRWRSVGLRATQLKLDLHDLSEDLPFGWETILEVARATYDAYAEVARLEALLAAGEKKS